VIEQVVQMLTRIQTRWNLDEVLAELPGRGLKLVQSAGKRRTFQDEKQRKYSFYFREDGFIRSVEATFDVYFNADSLSEPAYRHLIGEYDRRFEEALGKVIAVLGTGKDYSLSANDGFPHERDAIRRACQIFCVNGVMK
jgi:hypothetical protein